jgi:hypothetical protein
MSSAAARPTSKLSENLLANQITPFCELSS